VILKDEFEAWYAMQDHKGETDVFELDSDGEYMSLLTWSAYDDFKARNTPAQEGGEKSSCRQCGAPSGNSHCLGDIFNCSDLAAPEETKDEDR